MAGRYLMITTGQIAIGRLWTTGAETVGGVPTTTFLCKPSALKNRLVLLLLLPLKTVGFAFDFVPRPAPFFGVL